MKFNIDAFKRFNKYVNTAEKVELAAAPPSQDQLLPAGLEPSPEVPTILLCSSRPS